MSRTWRGDGPAACAFLRIQADTRGLVYRMDGELQRRSRRFAHRSREDHAVVFDEMREHGRARVRYELVQGKEILRRSLEVPREAKDPASRSTLNLKRTGLRDVAGNVWEWCEDRYGRRFNDAVENGGASREGWGRVVRGGSWRRAVDMARVSTRSRVSSEAGKYPVSPS